MVVKHRVQMRFRNEVDLGIQLLIPGNLDKQGCYIVQIKVELEAVVLVVYAV